MGFIFHSSFFIKFCEAKFFWASRFAARSAPLASGYPLHHPHRVSRGCGWFRYYPSRKNALSPSTQQLFQFSYDKKQIALILSNKTRFLTYKIKLIFLICWLVIARFVFWLFGCACAIEKLFHLFYFTFCILCTAVHAIGLVIVVR